MKKFRHELKFYINQFEYEILRKKVGAVLSLDAHSNDNSGYLIRSLYFDNMHDNDLYEKNYGILRRKKYRIRVYNCSDQVIKLERKNRVGEYIMKESASLSREEYEKIMSWDYSFLNQRDEKVMKDFYFLLRNEHLSPRLIVDYMREAYVGKESDVRITFDKGLSTCSGNVEPNYLFNPHLATVEALSFPTLIMEVKYNEYLPTIIRHLLQLDRHHRSAISKYVICREKKMQLQNF
ncbi:polyphosphate polymerase domain-containing protein [Pontibacillus sp. HMF3514]|uniref:polyphosphate polymerase domain-containing protein n=1 Tax=Pontibacillus sp. HMF3514 TaxID=2692425 RepID=UPI0013200595|nr:polyphosphate polymerase domain-containing protein [Pontibacillus sp. HMF3514]QHE53632.1 VTC domain-containing protein [Pontibacillus sp. HMF3514]